MQLLDFKFNPATFEQDFNVWETIKSRYERQSGQPLPDGVLVATFAEQDNRSFATTLEVERSNFADVCTGA